MKLFPDHRVDRVDQLRPDVLGTWGVQGLLVDMDETLMPASSDEPSTPVKEWAASLRAAKIPFAIVSNGRLGRVRSCAHHLGVDGVAMAGKPWPGAMRRSANALGVPVDRVAMVGDQLFTDALGARWAGLRSIMVRPISPAGLPHTVALRRLERALLERSPHGRPLHR